MGYSDKFTIKVSPSNVPESAIVYNKDQNISFINVKDGYIQFEDQKPVFIPYGSEESDAYKALLNYVDDTIYIGESSLRLAQPEGVCSAQNSNVQTCDVFRREVYVNPDDPSDITLLTSLDLVGAELSSFIFKDYAISNNRTYQYVFYPKISGDQIVKKEVILKVKWDSWSITELHPSDATGKNFTASKDDVWLFNFNVETGEQQQNIARQENITLGQYPRYSEGRQNYINGTVSCLLGSEMVSATYLSQKISNNLQIGEYMEYRIFDTKPTSNERVDMLKAWRRLVKSKNPKLLKDRKGQIFVVALTQSANKPYDNIKNQPDVINFSWTEVMSINDINILNAD